MGALGLFAGGIGAGAAVQAWRDFPPDGTVSRDMAMVVSVAGIAAAYYAGRWRSRGGSAVAVASAQATAVSESTSTAVNTVNVAVLVPQAAPARGVRFPGDAAPWMGPQIVAGDVDQLEGMDPAEVADALGIELPDDVS